jgi:hypothetical protein
MPSVAVRWGISPALENSLGAGDVASRGTFPRTGRFIQLRAKRRSPRPSYFMGSGTDARPNRRRNSSEIGSPSSAC